MQFETSVVSFNWREIYEWLAFMCEITCSTIPKFKSAIRLWITWFDSGTNSSSLLASFRRSVVAISNMLRLLLSSSAVVWGLFKVCYFKRHFIWRHQQWFVNRCKTYFGRIARESKPALFACKYFSSWSTIYRRVAAGMASNLCWRKHFHRTRIGSFANPQFFRCKWNQNKHSHHSIFFSSTWWRVMMIILRKASISTQLRRADLHISPN